MTHESREYGYVRIGDLRRISPHPLGHLYRCPCPWVSFRLFPDGNSGLADIRATVHHFIMAVRDHLRAGSTALTPSVKAATHKNANTRNITRILQDHRALFATRVNDHQRWMMAKNSATVLAP